MGMFDFTLNAEEKIRKARIQLQKEKPFWSFLVMHLNLVEDKDIETLGVDADGNLYYNPAFVDNLDEDEIKGVLAHEVMHCALEHFERVGDRDKGLFNISGDLVINSILTSDGMSLPRGVLIPQNNSYTIFGVELNKISEKTTEEIYDKLYGALKRKGYGGSGGKLGKNIKDIDDKRLDKHIFGKSKKSKDKKDSKSGLDKKINWKKVLVDATTFARDRGNLPAGMERIVGRILESFIDWKGILYKYITSQIPIDFTWAKPSKRSYSAKVYLPSVVRESIDIVCAIDTSGSISKEDLEKFLGELISIVKSFKNVNLTVIDCDCAIQGVHTLRNAQPSEIISEISKKLRGGGGTSHVPVFDYINKNIPNAKFVICFTDGYTQFPDKSMVKQPVLWVLCGSWRLDKSKFPYGQVLEIPSHD